MKTRKVASSLPLLAGMGLSIVALAVPFLLANHYIFVETTRYSADNYLFFFWGKYYTVSGANMIQSQMMLYDQGDFPVYAMAFIIIGIILGAISLFGGRGLVLNIKGRELKLKLDTNPVWLQAIATVLILVSYLYMNRAIDILSNVLREDAYTVEYGPALDFLLGGIVAMAISTLMTARKFLKESKDSKDSKVLKGGIVSQ